MAKWANALVLDNGPEYARGLAATADRIKMHVIKAYAAGDSHAVVIGNSCGSVSLAQADVPIAANGSNRRQTVAAKTIVLAANSGAAPDLHIAIIDATNSAVLLVTDETNNQQIYLGNNFNCPSWTYDVNQPT